MKDLGQRIVEKYIPGNEYMEGSLIEVETNDGTISPGIYESVREGTIKWLKPRWTSLKTEGQAVLINGKTYWESLTSPTDIYGLMRYTEKPPLGIMPQKVHDDQRREDLGASISRRIAAEIEIPIEWVDEYNEIIERWAE